MTARGTARRGFWASPIVTPMSSAPSKENTALDRTFQNPRKRPALPAIIELVLDCYQGVPFRRHLLPTNGAKAPGFTQYLKPGAGFNGPPVMANENVKNTKPSMMRTLRLLSTNSNSPNSPTPKKLTAITTKSIKAT